MEHCRVTSTKLAQSRHRDTHQLTYGKVLPPPHLWARSPKPLPRILPLSRRSNLTVGCSPPNFLPQQFGTICGNDSSRLSMHLRSHCLPRPSASSPLDNRAYSMANTSQVPNLEGLHREIHVTVDTLVRQTEPPFTERILRARVSSRFKLPTQLGGYLGKIDPMDHLDSYKSLMLLQGCSDEMMCKAFSATLKGSVEEYFRPLYHPLEGNRAPEGLCEIFNQALLEVKDPSDKMVIMAIMEGLCPGPLFDSLYKNVLETLSALQNKADKYIAAEELAEAKLRRSNQDSKSTNERRPRTPPHRLELILPPCNALITQGNAEEEVYNLSTPVVEFHPLITFNNDDLRGLHLPHDNALVISVVIANFNVQKILVDNRSSADILFISAFDKMKIGLDTLHPLHTPLVGFRGNMTHPLGWIKFSATLGKEPHQITIWQDFIVVDCPSPYNAILGRPTLGGTRAITSTYHLKMKFPTTTG
ncbi:hypothetical protein Acr_10g0007680 [Actinidia rufa]|uniref:Reverse transcriptase domain-containing protein n=1 Tax=Actinidia rufa TaxID=165716 RepID=A0A7J0F9V0_9ERIC|nr:hypothetical protein Acr_10g0007680 [Actinidia rufa]